MNHGSLFSGIGGFDLAAEWMGWENIFHCEWNPFGQKVLKYYWPDATSYNDITKTDFTIHRGTIDILTGGFPCQPYSTAGKRLGKEDERHLWPEMLRAIREISPCYVVGENVSGLVSWSGGMVFNEVQADMEAEGYEVLPFLLPACGVNAPHKRERVWFIAHANNSGTNNRSRNNAEWSAQNERRERQSQSEFRKNCINGITTNTTPQRKRSGANEPGEDETSRQQLERAESGRNNNNDGISRNGSNSKCQGLQGRRRERQRFEQGYWSNWPQAEPSICSGNDGLSIELDGITFSKWREESIKAFGNAIVPQVALQIFKAIESMSRSVMCGVGEKTNTIDMQPNDVRPAT